LYALTRPANTKKQTLLAFKTQLIKDLCLAAVAETPGKQAKHSSHTDTEEQTTLEKSQHCVATVLSAEHHKPE